MNPCGLSEIVPHPRYLFAIATAQAGLDRRDKSDTGFVKLQIYTLRGRFASSVNFLVDINSQSLKEVSKQGFSCDERCASSIILMKSGAVKMFFAAKR